MYAWTKNYVGIPFVSGGRDRCGADCYGLIRLVFADVYGISLPELSVYSNALDRKLTAPLFHEFLPLICADKVPGPEEKAVALMCFGGMPTHVGIYAGDDYILHCRNITGAVCERISSPALQCRIEGWYRVNESLYSEKSLFTEHRKTDCL